jgi:hypothetical protein
VAFVSMTQQFQSGRVQTERPGGSTRLRLPLTLPTIHPFLRIPAGVEGWVIYKIEQASKLH